MITWTADHLGTHYVIDASSLPLMAAGAVLMAMVAFAMFARTWSFERASLGRAALAWVLGTLLCSLPALLWAFATAVYLMEGTVLWHFPGLPMLTLLGLGWMGITGGLTIGLMGLKQWPEGHWLVTVLVLAPALLAGLLVLPAVGQNVHYASLGLPPLPTLSTLSPFHVGQTLPLQGFEPLTDSAWTRHPVEDWSADTAGEQKRLLKVTAGGVEASREVARIAGLESGSDRFPLAVGDRWVWVPTIKQAATERVFFKGGRRVSTTHPQDAVTMTVAEPRVDRGLRIWKIEIVRGADPPETIEFVPWNGKLVRETEFPAGASLFRFDGAAHLMTDSVSCTAPPFPSFNCECTVPNGWLTGTAPGPTHCRKRVGGDVGHGIARAITLFATLGMVDPGGKGHTEFMNLVEYSPAPEGALRVGAPWTPPSTRVQPVVAQLDGITWDKDKSSLIRRKVTAEWTCPEVAAVARQLDWDDGQRTLLDSLKPTIGDECHAKLMGLLPAPLPKSGP